MHLTIVLLLSIGLQGVHARPPSTFEEDDLRLTAEQIQYLNGGARIALSWSGYYWKGGTLVYSFGEGCVCMPEYSLTHPVALPCFYSPRETDLIEKAMAAIASKTCVRFRRTRNAQEPQVVMQRKEAGCWSYVGFLARQQQLLNLGERCMCSGTIQHEILHALGLLHTHCDPRRDQYVKIHPENLKPGYEHNFRLLGVGPDQGTDFGLGYDYESLMHYGEYAFSRNGQPTIVPLRRGVRIGQAKGLSAKDVRKLNRMYCRGN
ncbi:seminal metalloprotease 1 [Drosophila miranda]|uniref:seminal metalloprotease 1 n=1 Tax=Drosophila miranda TaxID=7229 RepID=UPI00143F4A0D|nr:seminal metalloprotease 1 [Drosophila miranda]